MSFGGKTLALIRNKNLTDAATLSTHFIGVEPYFILQLHPMIIEYSRIFDKQLFSLMGDHKMTDDTQAPKGQYDISIIRPAMRDEDFKLRGEGFTAARLAAIKKGLLTLHTLELMASTVYKFQITGQRSEMNRQLITAMCNEMGHYQDFQIKLYEYGFKPSKIRWVFWIVGFVFGFGSRLLGKRAMLKVGVFVESKAVDHYGHLLAEIDWDDETRKVVEKDAADEDGHINRWKALLQSTS